jgi:hypothetical protein
VHHIVDNHLFDVLFYLFYSLACLRPTDHRVESEPAENFQDFNFEDIEQQQAGFEGSVLDAYCTYFWYLSIGLHASNLCHNCGNTYGSYLSMYYPCYPGLG